MAFSEKLIIAFGSMTVVLGILILYAITLIVKLQGMTSEGKLQSSENQSTRQSCEGYSTAEQDSVDGFSEDEEERLVVALVASALAAEEKPNSHYHITKITRIK